MRPVRFPEQNCTYAKNSKDYLPLPAYKDSKGIVTSCWKLSLKERFIALFKGEVWLCLFTGDKPLTPSFMSVRKREIFKKKRKK